jgi:hypothetical protein
MSYKINQIHQLINNLKSNFLLIYLNPDEVDRIKFHIIGTDNYP